MKAFWWFKDHSIAGMARPGFNSTKWFDLPFDEAVLLGWAGQYSTGTESRDSFHAHLNEYAPKIFRFYDLDEKTGPEALKIFDTDSGLMGVAQRLIERTRIFKSIHLSPQEVHFELCQDRLQTEVDFLREQNISTIVSLTERHHSRDILGQNFETHHLSIRDLGAPDMEQVKRLAIILDKSLSSGEKLAVHCLAGIGRTSTMLITAHILLGEKFDDLKNIVMTKNPSFSFVGAQDEFIRRVAAEHSR